MYIITIKYNNLVCEISNISDLYNIDINNLKINTNVENINEKNIKTALLQILSGNKAIINSLYSYKKKDDTINYVVDQKYLKYITIFDIFKYFGVSNVKISAYEFDNDSLNDMNMDNHYRNLSDVIMNNLLKLYNRRLYNTININKSQINVINDMIDRQYSKQKNIKKEIVTSVINMLKFNTISTLLTKYSKLLCDDEEYCNNNNISSDDKEMINNYKIKYEDSMKLNLPLLKLKIQTSNVEKFKEIESDNNSFEDMKNRLKKHNLYLIKNDSNKIYVGFSLGEIEDNTDILKSTNSNYIINDTTHYNNSTTKYSYIDISVDNIEVKDLFSDIKDNQALYSELTSDKDIINLVNFINTTELKNVISLNDYKFKYVEVDKSFKLNNYKSFIKYILARYIIDVLNFSFQDIMSCENDVEKYMMKTYYENKYSYNMLYFKHIYNNFNELFKKYTNAQDIINDKVLPLDEKYIIHLYNEYKIACDCIENANNNTVHNAPNIELTTENEDTQTNDVKPNTLTYILNYISHCELEKRSILGVCNSNDILYRLYFIELKDFLLKYIDINKLNVDKILSTLALYSVIDTIYDNQKIELYNPNTLQQIKQFKDTNMSNDTRFKKLYKLTKNKLNGNMEINGSYNITFKMKSINKNIKTLNDIKNEYQYVSKIINVDNLLSRLAYISFEDIQNITKQYENTYFKKNDPKALLINMQDIKDKIKINLPYLQILLYQRCYETFKYIIPIKRKVDIYLENDENYKLDIVFLNDIKDINTISDIFVKTVLDSKINKSKYKLYRQINKTEDVEFKNNKNDKFEKGAITYEEFLKYKYKDGKIFSKSSYYCKNYDEHVKNKMDCRLLKVFKINNIPIHLLICDLEQSKDNRVALKISSKLLKNEKLIYAICYTMYKLEVEIYNKFKKMIKFKNFNPTELSLEVYSNDVYLNKVYLHSTIVDANNSKIHKTLEAQIMDIVLKMTD